VYRVASSRQLADRIFLQWIEAPNVARHAQAGQFLIVRINESGERVPLTISAVDGDLVRIVFMAVGKTTHQLAALREGDRIRDVVGPLGKQSEIRRYGTVAVVGGGAGIAGVPIIAQAAAEAGNHVIGIIGARNAGLLILEDEMREICDELFVTTDDGSRGRHGFAADVLKELVAGQKIDCTWIIGPAIMMKVTSEVTRRAGVKTFVSLNPVMVDGTGMCGSCRVTVGGLTRFACVDGPEFDAHLVNFDLLIQRQRTYLDEERLSLERYQEHICRCRESDRGG
jgi:ferredoxin/flavodoxin---NADP+ reductase